MKIAENYVKLLIELLVKTGEENISEEEKRKLFASCEEARLKFRAYSEGRDLAPLVGKAEKLLDRNALLHPLVDIPA